jgi:hypothetical protein
VVADVAPENSDRRMGDDGGEGPELRHFRIAFLTEPGRRCVLKFGTLRLIRVGRNHGSDHA